MGTVPGTVPGAVRTGTRRRSFPASPRGISVSMSRRTLGSNYEQTRAVVCGCTCRATFKPSLDAVLGVASRVSPAGTRRMSCAATRNRTREAWRGRACGGGVEWKLASGRLARWLWTQGQGGSRQALRSHLPSPSGRRPRVSRTQPWSSQALTSWQQSPSHRYVRTPISSFTARFLRIRYS
jgi:hypothetical protein